MRKADTGPENASREGNRKFTWRIGAMERLAHSGNETLDQMALAEMETLGQETKAWEHRGKPACRTDGEEGLAQ